MGEGLKGAEQRKDVWGGGEVLERKTRTIDRMENDSEILTKIGKFSKILTHRSVAQSDLNNEIKMVVENLFGLSL